MLIELIEAVDDENFLTSMLLEKDYNDRDSLMIAVEQELLDLIQAPKIEAVVKRIWNSHYETSGSFFEMSTSYQILMQANSLIDIEERNRFYKRRDIEGYPQYDSNFVIFQVSMFSRMKATGLVNLVYTILSILIFENIF